MRKDSFDMVAEDSIRSMFQDELSSVSASEQLVQRTLNLMQAELKSEPVTDILPQKIKWWQHVSIKHAAFAMAGVVLVIVGSLWFPRISSQNAMTAATMAAARAGNENSLEDEAYGLTKSADGKMAAETTAAAATTAAETTPEESMRITFSEAAGVTSFTMYDSISIPELATAPAAPPDNILRQVTAMKEQLQSDSALFFDRLVTVKTLRPEIFRPDQSDSITTNQDLISDTTYLLVPVANSSDTLNGVIPLFYSTADAEEIRQMYPAPAFIDKNGWFSTGFVPLSLPIGASSFSDSLGLQSFAESIVGESVTDVSLVDIGQGIRFALMFRTVEDEWVIPLDEGQAYRTVDFIQFARGQP